MSMRVARVCSRVAGSSSVRAPVVARAVACAAARASLLAPRRVVVAVAVAPRRAMSTDADSHDDFKAKRTAPAASSADSARETIEKDIASSPVFLFMKGTPQQPQCGFSRQVVLTLNSLGVPFKSRNVLEDPEIREGIKTYSDWPTIPQLYIGGEFVGGCDIVMGMNAAGELKPAIEAAGVKLTK